MLFLSALGYPVTSLIAGLGIGGLALTQIRTLDRTVVSIANGKLAEMRLETFAARYR